MDPAENTLPEGLVDTSVPPVQLSVKVGAVQFAIAPQVVFELTVISAGHPLITGGVVSVTVTVNEHVAVLPTASVAVYVTVVGGPIANILPGVLVDASVAPVQLSVKVGAVQFTTALQEALAFTVMFAGHPLMTGGVISFTVTMNEHVDVLPVGSFAV